MPPSDYFLPVFRRARRFAALLTLALSLTLPLSHALAQGGGDAAVADPEAIIRAVPGQSADDSIRERLESIYSQIAVLDGVEVAVREGVVLLSGTVSNDAQAQRALSLAIRVEGVVTVDDSIQRRLDVEGNVLPIIEQFKADMGGWARAAPLIGLALVVFFIIAFLGDRLARWTRLWRRLMPNAFLAEILSQAVRIAAILTGLVAAFNMLGATTLMGTILGGAGVIGLAIGFAIRDTMENYISSIMLSLRQPFRANDHVVIGDHEGKVVRLTSRATVLMTLDGNHLRIPNSTVFKAVILNYTRNPERRFDFALGIDAADDPVAAMKVGLDAIKSLPFVLGNPAPNAIISTVGDSNIVIKFFAWVNQDASEFGKARSLAIRATKNLIEERGFTLPEPIYRLRIDQQLAALATQRDTQVSTVAANVGKTEHGKPAVVSEQDLREVLDVTPDTHIEDKVNDERAQDDDNDLLDKDRPVE